MPSSGRPVTTEQVREKLEELGVAIEPGDTGDFIFNLNDDAGESAIVVKNKSGQQKALIGSYGYMETVLNRADIFQPMQENADVTFQVRVAAAKVTFLSHLWQSVVIIDTSGNFEAKGNTIKFASMKAGGNQVAAGAAAGELWHDTTDHTVKMGV